MDDEPHDGLIRLLTFEGVDVDVSLTGADGLRQALTHEYDVILLDVGLGDMLGTTVLRRLAGRTHASIVVATATRGVNACAVSGLSRQVGGKESGCSKVSLVSSVSHGDLGWAGVPDDEA